MDSNSSEFADCYALQGNGQRPSHHGDGYREGNAMFTLNTTQVHGVVYQKVNDDEETT